MAPHAPRYSSSSASMDCSLAAVTLSSTERCSAVSREERSAESRIAVASSRTGVVRGWVVNK